MMGKWLAPSLAFLASTPSAVVAEAPNMVFLTCDTIRYYKGADEGKSLPEKLYFKVDFKTSNVTEFNIDRGVYEPLCGPESSEWKFGEPQGVCSVGDEIVSVGSTEKIFLSTSWRTIFIYRSSGRISGSQRIYLGRVTDFADFMKQTPMVHYDISGVCQQGADMSKSKKAF